jgi:hypothetical protein
MGRHDLLHALRQTSRNVYTGPRPEPAGTSPERTESRHTGECRLAALERFPEGVWGLRVRDDEAAAAIIPGR